MTEHVQQDKEGHGSVQSCGLSFCSLPKVAADGNLKRFQVLRRHGIVTTDIDSLMAQELNAMSVQDRKKLLEELHGVAEPVTEDETLIETSLSCLEIEIKKIRKRTAYDRALFLRPNLVMDRSFRLMFLRGDDFDASRAARRIVDHFDCKLELFGDEKLVKPITFDDLTIEDQENLLAGGVQVLRKKDSAGRTVIFHFLNHMIFNPWENHIRSQWYYYMKALEDEATQKYGVVAVFWGKPKESVSECLMKTHMFRRGLPLKTVSLHYCFEDATVHKLISLGLAVMGKEMRTRFRGHYGSNMECMYALNSYGILQESLPMDYNGGLRMGNFLADLVAKQRSEREKEGNEKEGYLLSTDGRERKKIIEFPDMVDVLVGKGKPFQTYSGNIRLRELIAERWDEYQAANRTEKNAMNEDIVRTIKEAKGRFLQRDGSSQGGWVEVDDAVARLKVSHAFRNRTLRMNPEVNEQDPPKGSGTKRRRTK